MTAESGRIGGTILSKITNSSPWLKLIEKEPWPEEMGEIISIMTYGRSLPTTTVTWADVSVNDGSGNNSVPAAHAIEVNQKLRTFKLQQTALESQNISVNDLRVTFKRREQLSNVIRQLQANTRQVLQERFRDEYIRLAEHKIIARANLPEDDSAFPTQVPTSPLTQGQLDYVANSLIRDDAGEEVPKINGHPQFIAIMSTEAQQKIIQDNNTSTGIRTDFRESPRVSELLAPLGATHSYKNFIHMVDNFTPRWEFTGGAWVRVAQYTDAAVTNGTEKIVNPAYKTATYEDTVILHPMVYKALVPATITNPGSGVTYNPLNYMGDWDWKNIPHRTENPDGNWGFFRGLFMLGSKPLYPEWGYVIRHLRSDFSNQLLDS